MTRDLNEELTPIIYRKAKGQIIIEGKSNITDLEGNKVKYGNRFTLSGCNKKKTFLFELVHTNFRTPFFQIHCR